MSLRIYNSLTRVKEQFVPRIPGKVSMYVCGPTVYDRFHIGNARTFVTGDTIRRALEYLGYEVTYVQNFTDIEDKIIQRANALNVPYMELVEQQIAAYFVDAAGLNIRPATAHPRVTEHIPGIISFINELLATGHAYQSGGDVFFDVRSYPRYGELSGQKLDDLVMGSRVDVGEDKRYPADFVLWKAAKPDEPAWQSPFGPGRPGWHIECSVMVRDILGGSIDIHAGGMDLRFPHHENERAQSEVLNPNEPYVHYWLHVAFLNMKEAKMSKSLGNFFTASDLLQRYSGGALRFFLQSAHYRSPLNYSEELLESSVAGLQRLLDCVRSLHHYASRTGSSSSSWRGGPGVENRFREALLDDFNTADAWSVLFDLARDANIALAENNLTAQAAEEAAGLMVRLASVLGVELQSEQSLASEIEELIARRQDARSRRDFAASDAIRDQLLAMGIVLEDTVHGVRWKKK